MEAGDGSAGDGDKEKGKKLAGNDGASAVDIRREGWKLQAGVDDKHTCDQGGQRAQFYVGGEVVARLQQQPDRQHRSQEPVSAEPQDDLGAADENEGRT